MPLFLQANFIMPVWRCEKCREHPERDSGPAKIWGNITDSNFVIDIYTGLQERLRTIFFCRHKSLLGKISAEGINKYMVYGPVKRVYRQEGLRTFPIPKDLCRNIASAAGRYRPRENVHILLIWSCLPRQHQIIILFISTDNDAYNIISICLEAL